MDLHPDTVERTVAELRAVTGGRARGYVCDVTDPDAVRSVADVVRADVGDPDVVINNAGVVSGATCWTSTTTRSGVPSTSTPWPLLGDPSLLPAMIRTAMGTS